VTVIKFCQNDKLINMFIYCYALYKHDREKANQVKQHFHRILCVSVIINRFCENLNVMWPNV